MIKVIKCLPCKIFIIFLKHENKYQEWGNIKRKTQPCTLPRDAQSKPHWTLTMRHKVPFPLHSQRARLSRSSVNTNWNLAGSHVLRGSRLCQTMEVYSATMITLSWKNESRDYVWILCTAYKKLLVIWELTITNYLFSYIGNRNRYKFFF